MFHIPCFEQALYEALMKQEELLAYIDSQEDAKFRVSRVDVSSSRVNKQFHSVLSSNISLSLSL